MPGRRARDTRGVTLIELLVALLIVGVLAGIAVILVPVFTKRGDKAACESDRRDLERAIFVYEDRTGSTPASLTALTGDDSGSADDIVGNQLVRSRYTLTYSGGTISSCAEALAAGGSSTSPAASPPVISNCAPGKVKQGDIAEIKISGTGFAADAQVMVAGNGLTLTVKSRTSTLVTVTVTATAAADATARTVTVTNPGTGQTDTSAGCIEVQDKKK